MKPCLRALLVSSLALAAGRQALSADESAPAPRLPFAFVENLGQWDAGISFAVQRSGMSARFDEEGLTVRFQDRKSETECEGVVLHLAFENAAAQASLEGERPLPGRYNYFLGDDSSAWRSGARGFGSVLYRGLYDGVDVRFRENAGALEYDLLVAPGADLEPVSIRCEGVDGLSLDEVGSLVLETPAGPIRHGVPLSWVEDPSGERLPVECRYRILDAQRFGFELNRDDESMPAVIDPTLVWSTYFGGVADEYVYGLSADAAGIVTFGGTTCSTNLPATAGAFDTSYNGGDCSDAFVARLAADGSTLLWCSYLGGGAGFGANEWVTAVAVSASNETTVVGSTSSTNFPVTPGALDTSYSGGAFNGFVTRFSADGSSLVYSAYLSSGDTRPTAVAVDSAGRAILSGHTTSNVFPVTAGALDVSYNGNCDAFLVVIGGTGATIDYGTYLGGSQADTVALDSMTVTDSGTVLLAGTTSSPDFPVTAGAYDTSLGGSSDAFLVALPSTLNTLLFSTLLGGTNTDEGMTVLEDDNGEIVLAGATNSPDFPVTPDAFDLTDDQNPNCTDGFLVRFDATASALLYSTFFGGNGTEVIRDSDWDGHGGLVVVGETSSNWGFPVTPDAFTKQFQGVQDAFLAHFDGSGRKLVYSTYFGGVQCEWARAVRVDGLGRATLAGATHLITAGFPVTPGSFDTTGNGNFDGFVACFDLCSGWFETYGSGCAGSGGFVPALLGSGCPEPGGSVTITVEDAVGGAMAFYLFGLGQGSLPVVPHCAVQIAPILPQLILVLPLSGAGPGNGALALPGALPGTLPSTTIYMQVFVPDAGAADGVAATNPIGLHIGL